MANCRSVVEVNRKFKNLRPQLQRKRHIQIELCVKLSLLRLFHVGHVVQNRRSALSLAWHEWLSCKGKEWKIYCCELALSSEPRIWTFHVGRLRQKRGTWGFAVMRCWCFFDAVMRWIKSQFAVLRWSQILRCAMFVFFTLRCSVKWNYLRCFGFLCDWVMWCSLIFFAVLRCSGPPHVPLSKQCTKKRAARAARLFFFIQPITSLICGVVVDVAVVES